MVDVEVAITCRTCGETIYAGAKTKSHAWKAGDVLNAFVSVHRDCSHAQKDTAEPPVVLPPVLPPFGGTD